MFRELQADENTPTSKADENTPHQHGCAENPMKDLLDPSMYPLVYGRTPGLQQEYVGVANAIDHWSGKGSVVPKPLPISNPSPYHDEYLYWSENYQWLPANLDLKEDGSVSFTSYVNNLHPIKHLDAYDAIQKLVTASIPLWDQCLDFICSSLSYVSDDPRGPGRHDSRFYPPYEPE